MGREPPIAEPLDRWCRGWELNTPGYLIRLFQHIEADTLAKNKNLERLIKL